MKKKLLAIFLVLVMVFSFAACGGDQTNEAGTEANEGEVYDLVWNSAFGDLSGELKSYYYIQRWFFDQVKERSNGRLNIIEYYNGELYGTADLFDALANGTVDMGFATPHAYGQIVPEGFMTNIPLWCETPEEARKVFREEGVWDLFEAAFLEQGIRPTHLWIGAPYSFMTNFPVEKVSDLKGKTFRASGGLFKIWYDNLGINSIDITSPEAYDALSKGILDGDSQGWSALKSMKLGEVTKYLSTPSWQNAICISMYINEEKFQSLPEDLQKILLDTAKEAEQLCATEGYAGDCAQYDANIAEYGITVTEMSDEEYQKLVDSFQPAYDYWANMSPRCAEMLNIMRNHTSQP